MAENLIPEISPTLSDKSAKRYLPTTLDNPSDNKPNGKSATLSDKFKTPGMEYALAGMDNQLFVSTYMLQLPDKNILEDFLLKQLEEQNSSKSYFHGRS